MSPEELQHSHYMRRQNSFTTFSAPCPIDMKPHDWRAASHAPGWELGDTCASCQKCKLRAIRPE